MTDHPRSVSWQLGGSGCLICWANADVGIVPYGSVFPSGHTAPPAHERCECILQSEDPDFDERQDNAAYDDTSNNSTEDAENQPG
jgi:hypothetical protein